ncbi:branched-chain amino acid ABC transporter permease [Marinibaculum pumilum]|uniref:Branched-chain amino acid ABC transporter permease n=1 Tax=Marinibaculum pumilum TaxID=1766165 RepID=A0ABV7KVC1_9PROT
MAQSEQVPPRRLAATVDRRLQAAQRRPQAMRGGAAGSTQGPGWVGRGPRLDDPLGLRNPVRVPRLGLNPWYLALAVVLIAWPFLTGDFFTFQVGAYALVLGTLSLSLMFLAGYGGMVSLAQMTVAGMAGYMLSIFGESNMGLGLDWWLALPIGILVATAFATLVGLLSVRTEGIYTIMITLAIGTAFFYFARQNYEIFNGFNGFAQVAPPQLFGIDWRSPVAFYFLALGVAVLAFCAVLYVARSTFGLSMQAIRDNPRRMSALGFNVTAHRVAAYALAGLLAALAGILLVWFNGRISPGSVDVQRIINVLVIAVIGGLRHPIGPFLGAIVFVLLENFAIDLIDRERFNLVIGGAFLLIVFFSPDGLLGLWDRARELLSRPRDALQQRRAVRERDPVPRRYDQ